MSGRERDSEKKREIYTEPTPYFGVAQMAFFNVGHQFNISSSTNFQKKGRKTKTQMLHYHVEWKMKTVKYDTNTYRLPRLLTTDYWTNMSNEHPRDKRL